MRTVKKRHRDSLRALRFCRSALKLTFIFGAIAFLAMAIRIIIIEFDTASRFAELVRDIIILTSAFYALFLAGSAILVGVIYYLFKKYNVSTRMFRIRDLATLLGVQVILLLATAYISYSIMAE